MSGKQVLPYARTSIFLVPPEDIHIPGIDDKKDHYLVDVDAVRHALSETFVLNIMAEGVIEPVIVTKEGSAVVLVSGRRRVLHAREAKRRLVERGLQPVLVPCITKRGDEGDLFGIFVSENEHRMGDSSLGRARKAERMRNLGQSDAQIAVAFGVSQQAVANWKKALELDKRVLAMVDSGAATLSSALEVHGLDPDKQVEVLERAAAQSTEKKPTRESVRKERNPSALSPPPKKVIAKLLEERPSVLPDDFYAGVEWARGLAAPPPELDQWLDSGRQPEKVGGVVPAKRRK